jgi:hypothetical protein
VCGASFSFPGRGDDLPVAIGAHRRDEAGALHLFDQARGAVVADAQVALDEEIDGRRVLTTISTAWS